MIYLFLAEGFEEIEAVTVVDILRRADIKVQTAGVGGKMITGAHGITLEADTTIENIELYKAKGIVLPGGMPGTKNLENSMAVQNAIDHCESNGKLIGAICAAPMILGHRGMLKGRKATIFKGMQEHLVGAEYINKTAVSDGKIITGNGPMAAIDFSLALVGALAGEDKADIVRNSM